MTPFRRHLRQTLTIARRDFTATVFTPIFLLFLFAPIIMLSFSLIGGLGAANATRGTAAKQRLVLLLPADDTRAVMAADARQRTLRDDDRAPPRLVAHPVTGDTAAQALSLIHI